MDNACASGATAFRNVFLFIAAGIYDVGLAVGIEKMSDTIKGAIPPREDDLEGALGRLMPSAFAMMARRYMHDFGATEKHLALVSVKNHKYGALNPYAQYQKEFTIEEVLNSRMISEPITLLQCNPIGDGAAACVLASEDFLKSREGKKPVKILASALLSGVAKTPEMDITYSYTTERTVKVAYEMAGVGPEDIDVCELHDCFTIAEIMHYEELGFCARGEGWRFLEEGKSWIGGDVAVNTSGGLLSKGHPLGATGIAQIVEIVWQLRGECEKRQVPNGKVGMTHTMGGGVSGIETGACSIHIFGI
jgi:benzoylsuccinyl-CoA thiolase BbsB subunit